MESKYRKILDNIQKIEQGKSDELYLSHLEDWEFLAKQGWFGKKIQPLRKLSLMFSNLKMFPNFISHLSNLNFLHLGDNQITEIPPFIGQLSQLKTLVLVANQFKTLPDTIQQLTQLEHLGLNNNPNLDIIDTINKIQHLPHLQSISLSFYHGFPKEICQLTHLKKLFVIAVKADSPQNLVIPSEIEQLQNLEHLYLVNLGLKNLPDTIGNLENLVSLELTDNQIDTLPNGFIKLKKLKNLHLKNNPLAQEPVDAQAQYLAEDIIDGIYYGLPILNDYLKILQMEMPQLNIHL